MAIAGNGNILVGARLVLLGWIAAHSTAVAQDDPKTQQLRLLCAQLSGDLTDPGGMAAFQRCLTTHAPAQEIRRDNNVGSAAAPAAAVPAGCANCAAHDSGKPAPLGPGVNKGNIDNKSLGPQYFYFVSGPGPVELHYAFHEMGLFGNPYRQALNFDIVTDTNELIRRDAVESNGNLARFTRPGNSNQPMKVIIRVSSPDAAIRLGGYFEIEATGAAKFEGKTTGAGVKPEDTALVHPGGALAGSASLGGAPVALGGPEVSLGGPQVALTSGVPVSLLEPVGALTLVQQSPTELRLTLASDILFDFGSSSIRADARPALDRVAQIIGKSGKAAVTIEGFTDSIGTADANLRLSNQRADAVRSWLIQVDKLQGAELAARGLGATRFVAPNSRQDGSDDPAGRQKNRRVEVVIQKGR